MPIPQEEINTDWILASAGEEVAAVQSRLPAARAERAYKYVVWAVEGGRYIVVRWIEIEDIARAQGAGVLQQPIGALPGLPKPVEGVEQASIGRQAAFELRDAQPGKRLVVLANAQPIGLLTRELRSADALGADPFATATSAAPPPPMVLSEEDSQPRSMTPPPTAGAEPPPTPAPPAPTRAVSTAGSRA
jgi:hypothetical protein